MTTFLILIAVLQVLVLVPLLRPLWARQPTLTMVLLAILPLATMLLYRVVGNAQAIALAPQSAAMAAASGGPSKPQTSQTQAMAPSNPPWRATKSAIAPRLASKVSNICWKARKSSATDIRP